MVTVIQCWDDGVSTDIRLTDILRRYGAKASFNLIAGLHKKRRFTNGNYRGTQIDILGWDEIREIYEGFTIANHTLNHKHLEQMPEKELEREIRESRDRLQQFFGRPVLGFVYPFGTYNESVMTAVHEAGHIYARTTRKVERPFPPENSMAFHPSCHFLADDFWERYENTEAGGVFYFWGHSYEIIDETMWAEFEKKIERISKDSAACWSDITDLFLSDNKVAAT